MSFFKFVKCQARDTMLLRTLATLTENQGSVSSIRIRQLTATSYSSSRGSEAHFWPTRCQAHNGTHTHTKALSHIYKVKTLFKKVSLGNEMFTFYFINNQAFLLQRKEHDGRALPGLYHVGSLGPGYF